MGKTIDTAENCKTCRQKLLQPILPIHSQQNTNDGETNSGLHYKQYRKLAMAHQQSISAI
jgi:hypothetical protein